MTVTALMQPTVGAGHWMDSALCEGDDRFIQEYAKLMPLEIFEMELTCKECPVFFQCLEFHDPPDEEWHATGVFAAGEYFDEEEIER